MSAERIAAGVVGSLLSAAWLFFLFMTYALFGDVPWSRWLDVDLNAIMLFFGMPIAILWAFSRAFNLPRRR